MDYKGESQTKIRNVKMLFLILLIFYNKAS